MEGGYGRVVVGLNFGQLKSSGGRGRSELWLTKIYLGIGRSKGGVRDVRVGDGW